MSSVGSAVLDLVEANKDYFKWLDNGKIQCTLNQHTMPPRLEPLQKFINGSKFAELKRKRMVSSALKKYEPFLVPSKFERGFLFCTITGRKVKAEETAVQRHMKGRKFQKCKDMFLKNEMELTEEPEKTGEDEISAKRAVEEGMEEDCEEELGLLDGDPSGSGHAVQRNAASALDDVICSAGARLNGLIQEDQCSAEDVEMCDSLPRR